MNIDLTYFGDNPSDIDFLTIHLNKLVDERKESVLQKLKFFARFFTNLLVYCTQDNKNNIYIQYIFTPQNISNDNINYHFLFKLEKNGLVLTYHEKGYSNRTLEKNYINFIKKIHPEFFSNSFKLNPSTPVTFYNIEYGIDLMLQYTKTISNNNIKKYIKLILRDGCRCNNVNCNKIGTKIGVAKESHDKVSYKLYTDDGEMLTVDHVIPKSKGGQNNLSNYQLLCRECNFLKGNDIIDIARKKNYLNEKGL
jgi:hypothetical protein